MRTIIAVSKGIRDSELVARAVVESGWANTITAVSSHNALAIRWALRNGKALYRFRYRNSDGQDASHRRNEDMAQSVWPKGSLIVVWDGKCRTTKHLIETAQKHGLQVFEQKVGS